MIWEYLNLKNMQWKLVNGGSCSGGYRGSSCGGGVLQYSTSAQLPTKLEGLAYSNFYFQEIKQ